MHFVGLFFCLQTTNSCDKIETELSFSLMVELGGVKRRERNKQTLASVGQRDTWN